LVTHDYLTKLKNRQEFLKDLKTYNEIEGISTKLILMDIDGFSVFNDAFGNDVGDSILVLMSNNIVEYLKSDFNVYRVGGDSFAILLNNSQKNIDDFIKKLQAKISKIHYKDINVSVTFAYGERNNRIQNVQTFISSVEKVLIKNKSIKEKSHYSQRIASILEILTTKYEDEKEHSKQVRNICGKIGEVLGLSEKQINELKLSGHLHDIGKIAIPEEILHKPAKLTEDEYEIVKTHAEIGYRILNSVEEYQNVAIATLHHHERYDGFGYPKGLKGEDIPLFSRIICIVDAYEAMVSDRVYRKALGKSFAIEELKRCSGTQFDPFIVDVFIEHIEQF
ncbi:MAG: diguanylate cyclase, partial [Acholeplasmataceae bacterium]